MKKYIRLFLVILWMILIFYFSSRPAVVSNQQTGFIIRIFELLGLDLNSMLGDMASFAVRKAAHFSEYFILFLLWFNVLYGKFDLRRAIKYSIAAVFLYSVTDEFHQMFVPGRAARFRDVMIDLSGGCFAALLRYLRLRTKGLDVAELEIKEEDMKND
jgi:VanZ family protein